MSYYRYGSRRKETNPFLKLGLWIGIPLVLFLIFWFGFWANTGSGIFGSGLDQAVAVKRYKAKILTMDHDRYWDDDWDRYEESWSVSTTLGIGDISTKPHIFNRMQKGKTYILHVRGVESALVPNELVQVSEVPKPPEMNEGFNNY